MSTQPVLANLLQECLRQWLHTDGPSFINPSPQHTKLLTQQAQIGWDHLFQGQFSKARSISQHDYIPQLRNPPEGYSTQTWLHGIIWNMYTKIVFHRTKSNMDTMSKVAKTTNMPKLNARHLTCTFSDILLNHTTGTYSNQWKLNISLMK